MMREMEQGRGTAVNMNGLRVLVVIQRGGGGYCPNKWISLTNPTALPPSRLQIGHFRLSNSHGQSGLGPEWIICKM